MSNYLDLEQTLSFDIGDCTTWGIDSGKGFEHSMCNETFASNTTAGTFEWCCAEKYA